MEFSSPRPCLHEAMPGGLERISGRLHGPQYGATGLRVHVAVPRFGAWDSEKEIYI